MKDPWHKNVVFKTDYKQLHFKFDDQGNPVITGDIDGVIQDFMDAPSGDGTMMCIVALLKILQNHGLVEIQDAEGNARREDLP